MRLLHFSTSCNETETRKVSKRSMKPGKVSQNILNRSVLKCIEKRNSEVAVSPQAGEDCAVLRLEDGGDFLLSQSKAAPYYSNMGAAGVVSVVNNIAAKGGETIGVMVHLMIPSILREIRIKNIMKEIEEAASACNVSVLGGHTEVTDAVTRPIVSLTGIGKAPLGLAMPTSRAKPGQDVVLTKWIGLEGTAIIAMEKEEELLERLPRHFLEEAKSFRSFTSIVSEAATAGKFGVSAMHDVSEGGIFTALWELADDAGVGLSIDLKKIPVKQETIEICEFYHINPYNLLSGGSLLLVTDNGFDLVRELEKEGVSATVIGKTTQGNDRTISNGEETRFLDLPQMDEIYKVFGNDV